MYEQLTARLDESYTWFATGERVDRIREHTFTVMPPAECPHRKSNIICAECADDWQIDYDFNDPFPFPRVERWTMRELIDAGRLHVGASLHMTDTDTTAIITGTGGLLLPDGRVFDNPSAAANAVHEQ